MKNNEATTTIGHDTCPDKCDERTSACVCGDDWEEVLQYIPHLKDYAAVGWQKKKKWKLQMGAVHGWADLKASEDGGPYEVEYFNTAAEAEAEADFLREGCDVRVVSADIPEEVDLYE